MAITKSNLFFECVAEALGTAIIVLFGAGAVHAAVFTSAQSGLWQVAVVWGIAVTLAIYVTGAVSGAHLNPAITLAFATLRKFPKKKVPFYVFAQTFGAFLAGAILYSMFHPMIAQFESANGLIRGMPGSELSAMAYGEYFPNPAIAKAQGWQPQIVSIYLAILTECLGTALLAFMVFSLTDHENDKLPHGHLIPLLIGMTVAIIISVTAPITQTGLNPARDFGPRLFAYLAGWKEIAIPGPRGGFFTVYILAPIVGAQLGAVVYQFILKPGLHNHRNMVKE